MAERAAEYARRKLENLDGLKSEITNNSSKYVLPVGIQEKESDIEYYLATYVDGREGGDAQLIIRPYLDIRFEQEPTDGALNSDTDLAYEYYKAAINGNLNVFLYKLGGITLKKDVVIGKTPPERTMKGITKVIILPVVRR